MENLYEILEVCPDATQDDIKKSFQKLALLYHPDKQTLKSDNAHFQRISTAWNILGDPMERKRYDADWYNRNIILNSTGPLHDRVDIEEFEEGSSPGSFVYPCRCGDHFSLTKTDILLKLDVVDCPSCSLYIIVEYNKHS